MDAVVDALNASLRDDGGDFAAIRPPEVRDLLPVEPSFNWQDSHPPPQREWVVRDWIPARHTTLLYGNGGDGKSLLAQQLVTCIATGQRWLDMDVAQGRALGVFCEDPEDELHRRQHAINAGLGLGMRHLGNLRLLSRLGEDNTLIRFDGREVGIAGPFWWELREYCRRFAPTFVVLDTAADMFAGNENERPKVRQFIQTAIGRLIREFGFTALLLAHPSVDGMRSGSGTGGSTAWSNTVRSRLYLSRPDAEGAPSEARELKRMKANYAPRDAKLLLQWRDGVFEAQEGEAERPDPVSSDAVTKLFDELDRAWRAGKPWSYAPITAKAGRFFPAWAKQELGIPRERTEALLSQWQMNGCLAFEVFDTHTKAKGLRVLKRPGQWL